MQRGEFIHQFELLYEIRVLIVSSHCAAIWRIAGQGNADNMRNLIQFTCYMIDQKSMLVAVIQERYYRILGRVGVVCCGEEKTTRLYINLYVLHESLHVSRTTCCHSNVPMELKDVIFKPES